MAEQEQPGKQQLEEWHKDPSNWILGLFYFNKKDKRVMTPKRISALGWTINFANPYALPVVMLLSLLFYILIKFS